MWEICGQQGASLFVSIWTSQAHQTDIFSARELEHTCSHLELSSSKLKDICEHFNVKFFRKPFAHTEILQKQGFFSLQPAEALPYELLSDSCKALTDPGKHQEIYRASFQLVYSKRTRDTQHCRGTFPLHHQNQTVSAGRSSSAQPSRKSFTVFHSVATHSRDDQTHKHISCTCILEHFLQSGNKSKSTLKAHIVSPS